MRHTSVTAEQVGGAAARVLHNLRSEHAKVVQHPAAIDAQGIDRIRSCADFRALIPAYLSSSLTPSRKLLFEDHTHECVLCRKVLEEARRGPKAAAGVIVDANQFRKFRLAVRWAAAAAIA